MYDCSFIVGTIIPKGVKCIHSATKTKRTRITQGNGGLGLRGPEFAEGVPKMLKLAEAQLITGGAGLRQGI